MASSVSFSQSSLTDPSLQDLSQRYGFTPATTRSEVQRRLKEDEERIRREIRKELKIKEGVENLRRASAGSKFSGKADVSAEIKRSNARLEELNHELEEIRTFQLVTSDGSTSFSVPARQPGESSGHTSSDQDAQAAPETDAIDQGLSALEKRLAIELKLKKGAQAMIDRCEGNKKLLADAQMMLADTRCKIDYIRMQQLRLRNMKYGIVDENSSKRQEDLLIERIEEIRHHIHIESAVQEGSQNLLKHLRVLKSVDKKSLQEAENILSLARAKLELLRLSLDLRLAELPADSRMNKRDSVHQEPESASLMAQRRTYRALLKMAAVSGQLSVRLFGCRDLMEDVSSRVSKPDSLIIDSKASQSRGKTKRHVSGDVPLSNEAMASVYLDNKLVKQTDWKPVSQQCWDLRFTLDLDRSRELAIMVVLKDQRQMCALKFLRLEDFLYDHHREQTINLEPQGVLFADISFQMNSMISAKPSLPKRWHMFQKHKGTSS